VDQRIATPLLSITEAGADADTIDLPIRQSLPGERRVRWRAQPWAVDRSEENVSIMLIVVWIDDALDGVR
jgi:hypothetical protein